MQSVPPPPPEPQGNRGKGLSGLLVGEGKGKGQSSVHPDLAPGPVCGAPQVLAESHLRQAEEPVSQCRQQCTAAEVAVSNQIQRLLVPNPIQSQASIEISYTMPSN